MDDWERRRKLEEALRDAVQDRARSPAEERMVDRASRKRNPAVTFTFLVACWAIIAWIWLARPAFLFGPAEPPPPTPAMEEASLRFAMYLEHRRVEAYRATHGRLPATLAQVGPVEEGVDYQRMESGFVITGQRAGLTLRLTSVMSADSFLGNSLDVLNR